MQTKNTNTVGSLPQTSHLTRGWDDREASLSSFIPRSDCWSCRLSACFLVCKNSGCCRYLKHDLGEKQSFNMGYFRCAFCCNSDFITITKLYYLRVRHVRQEIGEWWAGSTLEGENKHLTMVWESWIYLQERSKGVFWGSARLLDLELDTSS